MPETSLAAGDVMTGWFSDAIEKSAYFMPHGHCYLWLPSLLWLHVISDALIGAAYVAIALILWLLVRRMRLPFSPVFIAFGLFIGLCGLTHFMEIWTVWTPDYVAEGFLKAATAAASVATAIGLYFVRPQVEEVVHAARLSEERRERLENAHAELEALLARLREAHEQKTRFFANVSHELRTPLALILGPAERMLSDPNLTDDQRRQLASVGANGRMLLKQVNDLLDVARLEAGEARLNYSEVELAGWIRTLATQFTPAAEHRRIRLAVDVPAQLIAEVDQDKFERIVVNLLSNAIKFTPDGGEVAVTLATDPDRLRLDVADSGPGIAPVHREAVFERFRQISDGTDRQHEGTGIGLAIVRDFAELHGGLVQVSESPLGGARFTVELPLAAPPDSTVKRVGESPVAAGDDMRGAVLEELARLERGDELPRPSKPGRPDVLVVEDNAEMRRLIADSLADCNVVTARDGHEGLERATALKPDLLVTDLMMPRMSGDQLVGAIRADDALAAMPILLLTARDDDALRVRLLQEGAQDYLTKPFNLAELRARAGNLIAAKRAGDTLRIHLASLSTDLEDLAGQVARKNRQLELALQAAEIARDHAEQASVAKSRFLGLISHELRTPLSTIGLNLQILARHGSGQLPEAVQGRISRLAQAAGQMSSLIEGLLGYVRAENGRLEPGFEPFDPVEMAREVVGDAEATAPAGLEVRLAEPAHSVPMLESDVRLLRVVLNNLLSNAMKFTPADGSVTVTVEADEHEHRLAVADTGPGIPAEDIPRLFEPFEQLEPVRRKAVPGVGLGLALVRQIVEALGGRIEVQSELGHGSMFRVVLPSRRGEAGQ